MGIITWQNLALPQFSGVNDGIRTGAGLLNQAGQNAQNITGIIQDQETENANRAVMDRMLSVQDPQEYARQMAAGQILGADQANASLEMLKQAAAQQDVLQRRADTLYASERGQMLDSQGDAASAAVGQAQELVKQGKRKEAFNLLGQQQLSLQQRGAEAKLLDTLEDDPSQLLASTRLGWEAQDRADLDQARVLLDQVRKVGNDRPAQQAIIDKHPNANVRFLTEQLGNQLGENISRDVTGSQATLGITGPSSGLKVGYERNLGRRYGNTVQVAMANGAPPPPEEGATMGEVYDWNQEWMLPASGDANTTATGPGQLVNKTRKDFGERHGQRLFGKDWRDVPWTMENERKLLREVYKEQGPGAWEATKNYAAFGPEFFKGKSYDEVESLLFAIDGGVLPEDYQRETTAVQQKMEQRLRNLSTGAKVILNSKSLEGKTTADAAAIVAKQLGSDKPREVEEAIRETVNRARSMKPPVDISEAEAGGLLLNSLESDSWYSVSWSDFRSDTNLMEKVLRQFAAEHNTARNQAQEFEQDGVALEKVKALDDQYLTARVNAEKALENAKGRAGSGNAAIKALKELENIGNKKKELLRVAELDLKRREKHDEALLATAKAAAEKAAEEEAKKAANTSTLQDPFGRALMWVGNKL